MIIKNFYISRTFVYVKCLDYNLKFHIITKIVIINLQNSSYTFCKYLSTKFTCLASMFFYRHQIKNKYVFTQLFLYFTSSKNFLIKSCVFFVVNYTQIRFAELKLLVVSVAFGLTCVHVGNCFINDAGN